MNFKIEFLVGTQITFDPLQFKSISLNIHIYTLKAKLLTIHYHPSTFKLTWIKTAAAANCFVESVLATPSISIDLVLVANPTFSSNSSIQIEFTGANWSL